MKCKEIIQLLALLISDLRLGAVHRDGEHFLMSQSLLILGDIYRNRVHSRHTLSHPEKCSSTYLLPSNRK